MGIPQRVKEDIRRRLQGKPHLLPVYTSSLSIPERLYEQDRDLFVVLNAKTQRYELHSLANIGATFFMSVGVNELDGRIFEIVRRNDLRVRGNKILEEVDAHNAAMERENARLRRDELENEVAERLYKPIKELAWTGV